MSGLAMLTMVAAGLIATGNVREQANARMADCRPGLIQMGYTKASEEPQRSRNATPRDKERQQQRLRAPRPCVHLAAA